LQFDTFGGLALVRSIDVSNRGCVLFSSLGRKAAGCQQNSTNWRHYTSRLHSTDLKF